MMHANKRRGFIREWNRIQEERAKLGLQEARLLAKIRAEFPEGNGGDLQFKEWCLGALGPVNTPLLLKKATASKVLGATFDRLRDWKTATALMNFSRGERNKIIKTINATRSKTAIITRSTVCTTGYKLGFRSSQHGPSTSLELHQKVDRLIAWIFKLYSEYDELPVIPNEVREAMSTSLGKAQDEIKLLRDTA
jgi:hypothetical protein